MHEAMFYKKLENNFVQCELCARNCKLAPGQTGVCRVRKNIDGKLYSLNYAHPVSVAIDPIEKKPLFHFHPGSETLSIATVGCNFRCKFCQNWEISQTGQEEISTETVEPEKIVQMCLEENCQGISYTYTEPTIFYEYAYDTAKIAHKEGLYNVFVSNGYINKEPLKKISKYLDAMNMDLKAFTDKYYQELCGVPSIEPVKETARNCKKFGIHLEITNLIIPGYNDNETELRKLSEFVLSLGKETPLHFSRFFPHYKMLETPKTPVDILERAREIAKEVGLEYVYIGNVFGNEGENTYCPNCGALLIERTGYNIKFVNLEGKKCKKCGHEINLIL